jgi:hypothetical protein
MKAKTISHIVTMLMEDIDEKRACLRMIAGELDQALDSGNRDEVKNIKSVERRVRAALREDEEALDDIIAVLTEEGGS